MAQKDNFVYADEKTRRDYEFAERVSRITDNLLVEEGDLVRIKNPRGRALDAIYLIGRVVMMSGHRNSVETYVPQRTIDALGLLGLTVKT